MTSPNLPVLPVLGASGAKSFSRIPHPGAVSGPATGATGGLCRLAWRTTRVLGIGTESPLTSKVRHVSFTEPGAVDEADKFDEDLERGTLPATSNQRIALILAGSCSSALLFCTDWHWLALPTATLSLMLEVVGGVCIGISCGICMSMLMPDHRRSFSYNRTNQIKQVLTHTLSGHVELS